MKIHELKIWPEYYFAVVSGIKKFEYRKFDRDFKVGDHLLLQEYDPEKDKYTGRNHLCHITYILKVYDRHNMPYAILSIEH